LPLLKFQPSYFCHTADLVYDLSGMISSFLICRNCWR